MAFPETIPVCLAYPQNFIALCLKTELLKESLTSYVGTLRVWKLRFAPWFPPTLFWVLRKEKLEEHLLQNFC